MPTPDDKWTKALGNAMLIMSAVPEEGDGGQFACPACKVGTVHWSRARSNKHIHLQCDGCKTHVIQ